MPSQQDAILAILNALPTEQPIIAATSALRIRFDYPYIRFVIYIDTPEKATAFFQKSSRAERDRQKALSIVFLSATWKLPPERPLCLDHTAIQIYLAQMFCS
ncbi:hypothetical protein DSL72_006209 [Monilinia vaccinii-corymbosi]|uniref:Helicase C-terminal domain-containing protein n=1 Tax=Monilinia vaccinii-corymbosi TaxID=61207 RepID=A0A8A3PHU8_9HELO|nr:hypothetical protein DSL72_006209 [Monilinia vaccinii-corymbosi]